MQLLAEAERAEINAVLGGRQMETDDAAIERIVSSLEKRVEGRFISWGSFFSIIMPSLLGALAASVGITLWLISNHAELPIHNGAVSQREFRFVVEHLDRIEANQLRLETKVDRLIE